MAFMGMVIAGAALLIIGGILLVSLILLIVATVLLIKKHRTAAAILYIIGIIPAVLAVACGIAYGRSVRYREYTDYSGDPVTIDAQDVEQMKQYLVSHDMAGLDSLLDKHPELIYYLDVNNVSLLEYGLSNCDVDIMQTAFDHGARFDDENAYAHLIYECTMDKFFDLGYWCFAYTAETKPEQHFTDGETTDEILAAAQFAIDHGAAVTWEKYGGRQTFAERVRNWIELDGTVSDKDRELLALAEDAME